MRKWHRQACQCSGIRHRRRNQLLEPAALVLKNVSWQSSKPHPGRTEIVICSRWYPGGVLAVPLPVARLRGPGCSACTRTTPRRIGFTKKGAFAGATREDQATQPDGSARTDMQYYLYIGTARTCQYLPQRADMNLHPWLSKAQRLRPAESCVASFSDCGE
jgi:hypothetical protein